jgi:hypothetical protein
MGKRIRKKNTLRRKKNTLRRKYIKLKRKKMKGGGWCVCDKCKFKWECELGSACPICDEVYLPIPTLHKLKLSGLKKMALAAGATEEALSDEIDDTVDPKAAAIEWLVQKLTSKSSIKDITIGITINYTGEVGENPTISDVNVRSNDYSGFSTTQIALLKQLIPKISSAKINYPPPAT